MIYPEDGSVPVPSPIMIVDAKYSANNNIRAAEALQEYFLSPAGQRLIIKGWMYGVRTDMEEHPYHSKTLTEMMKNTIPVDYEKCLKLHIPGKQHNRSKGTACCSAPSGMMPHDNNSY